MMLKLLIEVICKFLIENSGVFLKKSLFIICMNVYVWWDSIMIRFYCIV